MTAVPVPAPENKPEKKERSERELALWDYATIDDAQIKIVLVAICEGMSIKEACTKNSAITATYKDMCRALLEDEEVIPLFMRANGIRLMRNLDKLVEVAEEETPWEELSDEVFDEKGNPTGELVVNKLKVNCYNADRRLRADIYSKILRYCSGDSKGKEDEGSGGGITINIANYDTAKVDSATKTIEVQAREHEDGGS